VSQLRCILRDHRQKGLNSVHRMTAFSETVTVFHAATRCAQGSRCCHRPTGSRLGSSAAWYARASTVASGLSATPTLISSTFQVSRVQSRKQVVAIDGDDAEAVARCAGFRPRVMSAPGGKHLLFEGDGTDPNYRACAPTASMPTSSTGARLPLRLRVGIRIPGPPRLGWLRRDHPRPAALQCGCARCNGQVAPAPAASGKPPIIVVATEGEAAPSQRLAVLACPDYAEHERDLFLTWRGRSTRRMPAAAG
jgi:hypothetical protein